MLDATHADTFPALSELCSISRKRNKPVVFWVGAGVSTWAGLPAWDQLADRCFQEFSRMETAFDAKNAARLIKEGQFPAFFGACKRQSATRYSGFLREQLKMPANPGPVFHRFIKAVKATGVTRILSTNADELLERGFGVQTLLPNNLEIISGLIGSQEPFVAKLHGSVSDMSSLVFTDDEYASALERNSYLAAIRAVFQQATVVFIGYGLSDEYVLKIISEIESGSPVFGSGPHFACSSRERKLLPAPIRVIRYVPEPHRDHRSVIQVLDELAAGTEQADNQQATDSQATELKSAHMLAELIRPGTWVTSQRVEIEAEDGEKVTLHCGDGLIQSERPFTISTATHDLAVGLLCFDRLYVPLGYLRQIHDLAGGGFLNELVSADVLRLVLSKRSDAVAFRNKDSLIVGSLVEMGIPRKPNKEERTLYELISQHIRPIPGKEKEAFGFIDALQSKVIQLQSSTSIDRMVRGLLLRPSVRALLGMSGGTKCSDVPIWMMYPILRLASVARLGSVCQELGLGSVKFNVGSDQLAGPVFAAAFGATYAEQVASYVVAGNFNTDLGGQINRRPEILKAILTFRDTRYGQELRREVFQQLAASRGGDVTAAINGGLNRVIGTSILQGSRNEFSKLCLVEGGLKYPALWQDHGYGARALKLWRQRAKTEFTKVCTELKLFQYDPCPCGSGEKIKFCCQESLDRS